MDKNSRLEGVVLAIAYWLGAIFAAWASYRMHIIGNEAAVLPMLEEILSFSGRAPDQYRIIPYILIGAIHRTVNVLPWLDVGLRASILVFDSIFLCLSALAIRKHFPTLINSNYLWGLFLIYPFLMFDGYRPISSFILYLSVHTVVLMRSIQSDSQRSRVRLVLMIGILSFTRADVAFLFALSSFGLQRGYFLVTLITACVPLVAQILLSKVFFPDAEYFSPVLMVSDNLSLRFMIGSPLTYFFSGLLILFRVQVTLFIKESFKNNRIILMAMFGYIIMLFVVARPNEFRLFLPLLPLVFWLLEDAMQQAA